MSVPDRLIWATRWLVIPASYVAVAGSLIGVAIAASNLRNIGAVLFGQRDVIAAAAALSELASLLCVTALLLCFAVGVHQIFVSALVRQKWASGMPDALRVDSTSALAERVVALGGLSLCMSGIARALRLPDGVVPTLVKLVIGVSTVAAAAALRARLSERPRARRSDLIELPVEMFTDEPDPSPVAGPMSFPKIPAIQRSSGRPRHLASIVLAVTSLAVAWQVTRVVKPAASHRAASSSVVRPSIPRPVPQPVPPLVPQPVVRALTPATSNVWVTAEPPVALYVDRKLRGTTPLNLVLDGGPHQALALAEGFLAWRGTLHGSEQQTLSLVLIPVAPPSQRGALTLRIRCPEQLPRRIFLDGSDSGAGCPGEPRFRVTGGHHIIGVLDPATDEITALDRVIGLHGTTTRVRVP